MPRPTQVHIVGVSTLICGYGRDKTLVATYLEVGGGGCKMQGVNVENTVIFTTILWNFHRPCSNPGQVLFDFDTSYSTVVRTHAM